MERLSELIDRYGEAIEADLADRGLDLLQLWQQRRFRTILNVVDHLPRTSHFVAALSDDDAWAEQVLAAQRRGTARAGAAGVPMTHWSPEYERLTDLFDRVGELIRAVAMAGGGKPGRVHPAPRPTTALERIRRRQARQQHRRLVATLLPGRDSAPP